MYMPGGTIEDAINQISRNSYVLPAIQREFVWKPEQIERLFDSVMQGYPFGTFLFWRVDPDTSGKFRFYDFVRNYHEKDGAHCPDLDNLKGREVIAVLDGQQRLTALNIGIRGSMAWRLKHKRKENPDAYPKRRLHLDLLGYGPAGEEGVGYRFKFLTDEAAAGEVGAAWFPVPDILNVNVGGDVLRWVQGRGLEGEELARAYNALDRLRQVIRIEKIVSYYEEKSQDLDRVLNIFIRLNSGGTVLSYSDLLMSIAVAQWKKVDARDEIHSLVDDLNDIGAGFDFSHDFVLKAGLMLADIAQVGFKVENFTAENMAQLELKWHEIRRSLILTIELAASFGLSRANLRADSALLPVAYYLHRAKLPPNFVTLAKYASDRGVIRFWLIRSLLKPSGIWGSGLDTLLTAIRDALRKDQTSGFPADELARIMAARGKPITFEDEEIEDLLWITKGEPQTFLLLSLLFPFVDLRNQFHLDHVFPFSRFTPASLKKKGLSPEEIYELRWAADSVVNLQLLDGPANVEKQAKLPAEWLKEAFPTTADREAYCARHELGNVPAELSGFEDFLTKRSERLRTKMAALLTRKVTAKTA